MNHKFKDDSSTNPAFFSLHSSLHSTPSFQSYTPSFSSLTISTGPYNNEVTVNLPHDKIIVKSNLGTFDKVFSKITQALTHRKMDDPVWSAWSPDLVKQAEHMCVALQQESKEYHRLSESTKKKDWIMRSVQLSVASVNIFINTSSIESTILKNLNIGLGVMVTFLGGLQGVFDFKKRAYQYAEISLTLDGLSRSLKTQLATPVSQRRDPSELILFIENTRDKVLKKLIHN